MFNFIFGSIEDPREIINFQVRVREFPKEASNVYILPRAGTTADRKAALPTTVATASAADEQNNSTLNSNDDAPFVSIGCANIPIDNRNAKVLVTLKAVGTRKGIVHVSGSAVSTTTAPSSSDASEGNKEAAPAGTTVGAFLKQVVKELTNSNNSASSSVRTVDDVLGVRLYRVNKRRKASSSSPSTTTSTTTADDASSISPEFDFFLGDEIDTMSSSPAALAKTLREVGVIGDVADVCVRWWADPPRPSHLMTLLEAHEDATRAAIVTSESFEFVSSVLTAAAASRDRALQTVDTKERRKKQQEKMIQQKKKEEEEKKKAERESEVGKGGAEKEVVAEKTASAAVVGATVGPAAAAAVSAVTAAGVVATAAAAAAETTMMKGGKKKLSAAAIKKQQKKEEEEKAELLRQQRQREEAERQRMIAEAEEAAKKKKKAEEEEAKKKAPPPEEEDEEEEEYEEEEGAEEEEDFFDEEEEEEEDVEDLAEEGEEMEEEEEEEAAEIEEEEHEEEGEEFEEAEEEEEEEDIMVEDEETMLRTEIENNEHREFHETIRVPTDNLIDYDKLKAACKQSIAEQRIRVTIPLLSFTVLSAVRSAVTVFVQKQKKSGGGSGGASSTLAMMMGSQLLNIKYNFDKDKAIVQKTAQSSADYSGVTAPLLLPRQSPPPLPVVPLSSSSPPASGGRTAGKKGKIATKGEASPLPSASSAAASSASLLVLETIIANHRLNFSAFHFPRVSIKPGGKCLVSFRVVSVADKDSDDDDEEESEEESDDEGEAEEVEKTKTRTAATFSSSPSSAGANSVQDGSNGNMISSAADSALEKLMSCDVFVGFSNTGGALGSAAAADQADPFHVYPLDPHSYVLGVTKKRLQSSTSAAAPTDNAKNNKSSKQVSNVNNNGGGVSSSSTTTTTEHAIYNNGLQVTQLPSLTVTSNASSSSASLSKATTPTSSQQNLLTGGGGINNNIGRGIVASKQKVSSFFSTPTTTTRYSVLLDLSSNDGSSAFADAVDDKQQRRPPSMRVFWSENGTEQSTMRSCANVVPVAVSGSAEYIICGNVVSPKYKVIFDRILLNGEVPSRYLEDN